jgi:hypothetical protein
MTAIIGVNHLAITGGFLLHFIYPHVSDSLFLDYVKGQKVGLELIPPIDRKNIDAQFWKDNPRNIYSLYNPETKRYFEKLEQGCEQSGGSVVYLDSIPAKQKQIEIDKEYREKILALNELFFYRDFKKKSNTHKLAQLFLEQWKLRLEASRIDVLERDDVFLDNILKNNLDTVVVGMGHAHNWMRSGKYDFKFLGEDTLTTKTAYMPVSSLDTFAASHDFKYFDIVLNWQMQLIEKNRQRQPEYIGLFYPFTMQEYFEVFLDSGKKLGECFDTYGHSKVEVSIDGGQFHMKKKYVYHTRGHLPEFHYSGEVKNNKIVGRIKEAGLDFIMFNNSGNALDTLEHVYYDPLIIHGLKTIEGIPINDFPSGIGNATEIITNPFNNSNSAPDDLPF